MGNEDSEIRNPKSRKEVSAMKAILKLMMLKL